MDILFIVLIALAAIAALWLVFRFLGGCLVRILLVLAVLAVVGVALWYLIVYVF